MAQQMVYHSILKGMCFAELLGVVLYKCQLIIKVVDSVQITSAFIYHCLVLLKSPIIIIELSVSHLTSVPIHPGMFYVWVCFCVWDLKNQKSLVVYYAHCSLSLCFCTLFLSLNSSRVILFQYIYPSVCLTFLDDYYISLYDFHNSFNQSLLLDTWVASSFLLFQIAPQCISFVHI